MFLSERRDLDHVVSMGNILKYFCNFTLFRILFHKICFTFVGGLGRAVLVGSCLTLAIDVDATPTEVIAQMRALRGPRAVQSVKQYNFINEYRELSINDEQLGYRDDDNESCVSR